MLSPESLLQRRFENRRPGLELIAVEDAALPVTLVHAHVVAQDRKPLPLLHEILLRMADAGVRQKAESASFLGIEEALISSAIVDQVAADNLGYNSATGEVRLTDRGVVAVRDHESIVPIHVQISVPFDRLTWRVANYHRSELVTKQEARDRHLILLPAPKTTRISLSEVSVADINQLLRLREGRDLKREVLHIRQIVPNTHRFLPVKLLVYGDLASGDVEVSVVVDGDASDEHDQALHAVGGAEKLGIRVEGSAVRPTLSPELEDLRVPEGEVAALRAATIEGRLSAAEAEAASIADPSPTSSDELSLSQIEVRSVSVFEHRDLLREALDTAEIRLLLISPWIRTAVVDDTFLSRLERCLRRGVPTTIAYGIGHDDRQSDAAAIARLAKLSDQYANFNFVRVANSHAKVLIFDNIWISTSFNWLSFKGDPERTYRMEEGTLVRIPGHVTKQYHNYLAMIEEQEKR